MQDLAITFDDVLIKPRFSDIGSRAYTRIGTEIGNHDYSIPVVSANMDTITGVEMATAMLDNGAAACLHRFQSVESTVNAFLLVSNNTGYASWVSVGISDHELQRAVALYKFGARTIVIDVAHGAQQRVADQYKRIKDACPEAFIIVGNFASHDSVCDFILGTDDKHGKSMKNGCGYSHMDQFTDGIKVGIGPGSACTTRIKTGVGVPQLSAIIDVVRVKTNMKVIADGGMRTSGDIAKALAAGADMCMLGGMLAGTDETPGHVILGNPRYGNINYKQYRGSASKEAYEDQGRDDDYITAEGESFEVPCKGPVKNTLKDIEGGLRSAFTYVGANNLAEFQAKAQFIRVSPGTIRENGAHGKL